MFPFLAVQNTISGLRAAGAPISTVAIITAVNGVYQIDHGVPAAISPNARFGRALRKNSHALGICKTHSSKIMVNGDPTTTAYWS